MVHKPVLQAVYTSSFIEPMSLSASQSEAFGPKGLTNKSRKQMSSAFTKSEIQTSLRSEIKIDQTVTVSLLGLLHEQKTCSQRVFPNSLSFPKSIRR